MDVDNSDSGSRYMSFLSRYSSSGPTAPNQGSTNPSRPAQKGNTASTNMKTGISLKSGSIGSIGSVAPTSGNTQLNRNLNTTSAKPITATPGAQLLKRKAEDELLRQGKVNERVKSVVGASTSAISTSKFGTGSAERKSSEPTSLTAEAMSAKVPKKGSYLELLQRARTVAANQKAPVGAIVNKPRPPPEKKEKEWQKKVAEERAAKGKVPGPVPSGEKAAPLGGTSKGEPNKKNAADAVTSSKKVTTNGAPVRKSSTSAATAIPSKAPRSDQKPRMELPSREKERPAPQKRPKLEGRESASRAPPRYVYREDSYDSDSDMEAAGLDILEEEERSYRAGKKEDLEQELLEKRLAVEKARKKG